jgi:hypothetical protein
VIGSSLKMDQFGHLEIYWFDLVAMDWFGHPEIIGMVTLVTWKSIGLVPGNKFFWSPGNWLVWS